MRNRKRGLTKKVKVFNLIYLESKLQNLVFNTEALKTPRIHGESFCCFNGNLSYKPQNILCVTLCLECLCVENRGGAITSGHIAP